MKTRFISYICETVVMIPTSFQNLEIQKNNERLQISTEYVGKP